MENNTLYLLKTSAFVLLIGLRIFIANYCGNKALKLHRNEIYWQIFGFSGGIIAVIWIQFMKSITTDKDLLNEMKNSSLNKMIKDLNEDFQGSLLDQKESLIELKSQNLLTEDEYQEKLSILTTKNQELIKKNNEEKLKLIEQQIEGFINDQIRPNVVKLELLHKEGLLTDKEFDQKKELLFKNKRNQFDDNPFERVDYSELLPWQQKAIKKNWKTRVSGDIYLVFKPNNSIKKVTLDEFKIIKFSFQYYRFLIIDIPDLS